MISSLLDTAELNMSPLSFDIADTMPFFHE